MQGTFDFTSSHARFWDSIPVFPEWRVRELVDELLDYDVFQTPDPFRICAPVAVGLDPDSRWSLQDLIACSMDDVYPAMRSNMLSRFVRTRLGGFRRTDLARVPWSRESAGYDRDYVPPWARDRRMLDRLEKSIRMSAWEALPVLQELVEAERKMIETSSAAFLRTGVYLWRTSFSRIPRTIRESSELMAPIVEANKALEGWYSVDVQFIVDRMVLPRIALEYDDEPLLINGGSSDGRAFGPVAELGLSADDVAAISDLVDDMILGRRYAMERQRRSDDLPERCRPFVRNLEALIAEIARREGTCVLEA